MKILIRKDTKISYYMWDNDVEVTMDSENTYISSPNLIPPKQSIGDMNSNNAEIIENVEPPADWTSLKYTYDGGEWAISSEGEAQITLEIIQMQEMIAELEKGK